MDDLTQHYRHDRIIAIVPVFYNSELMADAISARYTSFQELADFIGQSADGLEMDLLALMKQSSAELLAYYEANPIDPMHKPMLEAVQNSSDYWVRLSAQELYLKTNAIDTFLKYYPYITTIENPYLLEIGKALPYPITALDTVDDYYDFLFQIPFVYSFELDFNAFVSIKTKNVNVPFIRYNYPLFSVMDAFIETVAYVIFESSDNYRTSSLRSIERIRAVSQESQVSTSLHIQMKMLMGEVAAIAKPRMSLEASNNLHHGVAAAIGPFLYCHELGHLISGHLAQEHYMQMEYEADTFAVLYIKGFIDEHGERAKFKIFLGLAAFFCLLYCRERLLKLSNPDAYPTATERYLHIVSLFNESEHARMDKAWNNIVLATDYTLVKDFNITIPFANVAGGE